MPHTVLQADADMKGDKALWLDEGRGFAAVEDYHNERCAPLMHRMIEPASWVSTQLS
jgi:hypothetical protein